MTTNYSYFIAANFLKKWIHTSSWGLHLFAPHLKSARAIFLISGSPLWWQIELSLSPLDNRKNGQNKWGKVVQRRWFEVGFWVTEGWFQNVQCQGSGLTGCQVNGRQTGLQPGWVPYRSGRLQSIKVTGSTGWVHSPGWNSNKTRKCQQATVGYVGWEGVKI